MTLLAIPIFDHAHPKTFCSTLAYVNFYQDAKNHAISLFCSGDMADEIILQFDWLITFWPISQEQKFS